MTALAPTIVLVVGGLVRGLAGCCAPTRRLRPWIVAATLAGAGFASAQVWRTVPELDAERFTLGGTFLATPQVGLWSLVFLGAAAIAWWTTLRPVARPTGTGSAVTGSAVTEPGGDPRALDGWILTATTGMLLLAGAQDLRLAAAGFALIALPPFGARRFAGSTAASSPVGFGSLREAAGCLAFLIGGLLLGSASGETSWRALRAASTELSGPATTAGTALVISGLLLHLGAVPLRVGAMPPGRDPLAVTVMHTLGSRLAVVVLLLELGFLVPVDLAPWLGVLAVLTLAVGHLGARSQVAVGPLLTWTGLAQAGALLLPVTASASSDGRLEPDAMQAVLVDLAAFVAAAGGAFTMATWHRGADGAELRLEDLAGLGRRRPGMAAGWTLFLLGLVAFPGTGGFLGRLFGLMTVLQADGAPLATVAGALALVAFATVLRIVASLWLQPARDGLAPPSSEDPPAAAGAGFCAAMVVALGILPRFLVDGTWFS